jgi:fatty-acyl-CoA synthase/O-succinylbenzoic acid--CoA ligase
MNLSWWLERASAEYPAKTAIIDASGDSIDYADLQALVNRIGHVLRVDMGVKPDDVVVSCMADNYLHVAVMYAVMRIGAVFSGLNHKQVHEKFHSDIARCKPKAAIVAPEFTEIADLIGGYPEIAVALTTGAHKRFPSLDSLAANKSAMLQVEPRSRDDIAAINFTAGTSGSSKGVIFTHGKLETSCWGSIFLAGVDSSCRNLSLVGMFHSGGIADAVRLVMVGGTLLWSEGWDVDRVVNIIKIHKPNFAYYIVPTMMRDLMRHADWDDLDISGLKTHVAGEVVPPEIEAAMRAKGAIVGAMYGMTETMPVRALSSTLHYRDEDQLPRGSSGRPNKEFCEVVLKDPYTGEVLEGGDVEGEICLRGDVVTPGYYNDPERTAAAFDEDGYLHTNDRGYRDANGWYFIRGRTDDMILSGAEKLSLLEVDKVLLEHPDIRDAACVGVAHERFGEVPAAFVVLKKDLGEATAREMLDAYCCEAMERWKRPRLYVFVEAIPRTAAKQTKMAGELRRIVAGITVANADGVVTLGELQARGIAVVSAEA